MKNRVFKVGFLILACCALRTVAADFSGNWDGDWTSYNANSGWMEASVTQAGSGISGSLNLQTTYFGNFYDIPLTGSVSGEIATMTGTLVVDGSTIRIEYTQAVLSGGGTTVSGNYTITENGTGWDSGTFEMYNDDPVLPPTPDLTITGTSPTSITVNPGDPVSISVTTKNLSNLTGVTDALVDLWINTTDNLRSLTEDELFDLWGHFIDEPDSAYVWIDELAAGASVTQILNFSAPATPGKYYLRTKAYQYFSDETNLDNNWGALITLTVNAPPGYALTVENGSGDGPSYPAGQSVAITADSPPIGQLFDHWVVSPSQYVANLGSATASSTTFTMPAAAVTLTATYKPQSLQGSGTSGDPYRISTKADLMAMAADRENYRNYFKMTADIDLAGEVFTSSVIGPPVNPIGSPDWAYGIAVGYRFTGTFDGNGHVIRNLTINDPVGLWVGLFGQVYCGIVKNLGLENCNITAASISGHGIVGGICGDNLGGTVENCYVTGTVRGQGYVGGICGDNYQGTVKNCYSFCEVSASWRAGGLCGRNYEGRIENCYAAGPVSGGSEIGGLTGNNNYGGTVSTTLNSFWDTQVSGRATSAGGTGKTTAQMKSQTLFIDAGWDFSASGSWSMSGSDSDFSGYPVLSFQPEANRAPLTPMPVSPANAVQGRNLTLTLQGSAFSDPDGDTHANSQWQVDDGNGFSSPEWDSGENWVAGIQTMVPVGRLTYSTRYYWRMRYKDSRGSWSEWSYSRTFTTESLVRVTDPDSGGSITPSGDVPAGTDLSVTLTAIPDAGCKLKHWLINGQVTGAGQEELVLDSISENMTVQAVFERINAMPWLNLLLE